MFVHYKVNPTISVQTVLLEATPPNPCQSALARLIPSLNFASTSLYPLRFHLLVMNDERLDVPNHIRVLIDATITAEEAHASHRDDRLLDPLLLVLVRLVHEVVRLDVAVEVIRNQVVVAVLANSSHHGAEVIGRAKCPLLDLHKHLLQVRVNGVISIVVGVT